MSKFCSECGYKFEKEYKFCPECGTKVSGSKNSKSKNVESKVATNGG